MAKYFSVSSNTNGLVGTLAINYPEATGGGPLDIYHNGYWKIGTTGSDADTHQLWVQEFNINSSALFREMNAIKGKALSYSDIGDFYSGLYLGKPTGFFYNLPRVIPSGSLLHPPLRNTWTNSSAGEDLMKMGQGMLKKGSKGGGKINQMRRILGGTVTSAGKMVQAADKGSAMAASLMGEQHAKDPIKTYEDSDPYSISVNFQLYNTPRDGSGAHVDLHVDFVHLFYFQNLKSRTGPFSMIPPKLYVVKSSPQNAGMTLPVAYVENYDIKSMGKTHVVNGKLIPEAYDVTIKFTSLVAATTNTFKDCL
jgi:hypothetical protein